MSCSCRWGSDAATRLAALLLLVLAALAWSTADAATNALSEEDEQCLACHATKGLAKKLANGETLDLHIDGAAFARSVHNPLGCAACHSEATLENHPPLKAKIGSLRENSLTLTKACRSCHADIFKQYENSTHAALLREGNAAAPYCGDCHSPHAMVAKTAYDNATGAPCSTCHDEIFTAYTGSMHGQAHKRGDMGAPVCSSCHGAHDVRASAAEERVRDSCRGCHADVSQSHRVWLPNAERHLHTVSCAACHAPGAVRKVDLRLYDRAGQERITQKEGVPQFEVRARAIDTEGKGLDALALQSLLREFGRDGVDGKVILRGRLEVSSGVEAHQLTDKSRAVRQCESCHSASSTPFQSVTISIAGPDGRPVRYGASQDVLRSAISVDSIGGFYVIGGTRIQLLDVLVVLVLAVGVGTPLVHATLAWLFRRYAKRISGREDS